MPARRKTGYFATVDAVALPILLAVSLVIGAGLVSYSAQSVDIGEGTLRRDWNWHVSPDGYQFRYPASWQLESGEETVIRDGDEEVVVRTLSKAIESGLFPDATFSFTLNGIAATRYRDADPASGEAVDRVVIKRPDGRVNEIRGTGSVFETIVTSFKLTNTK